MNCETCGGPTWNNAQKNVQRVNEGKKPLPLWVCKDKEGCGWVKWAPKGANGGGSQAQRATGGNGAGTARPVRPLGPLYYECVRIAEATIRKLVPEATGADIIAGAATLFIGASNSGAPLTVAAAPPKPRPAPPPPPPPQENEDGWEDGDMAERDLPF